MSVTSPSIVLLSILCMVISEGLSTAGAGKAAVPLLHATDLYRPYNDPDDHWDLACIYAMARRGDIDLRGIVIDYPPDEPRGFQPDLIAVAQMNRIAGLAVPVAVGSPHPMKSRDDAQPYAARSDLQGVQLILKTLRESDSPVTICIAGSSRDVAVAGGIDPNLFARKCAGVYLNAGTGLAERNPSGVLEYNVKLDRMAYAAIFDLPCPVFWLPCFEGTESDGGPIVRPYASHYAFRQGEILPRLSSPLKSCFACMFSRNASCDWLGSQSGASEIAVLADQEGRDRHMWCTAGFSHLAGYAVLADGQTVPRNRAGDESVYRFEPVQIACGDDGVTRWRPEPGSQRRFILRVCDVEHYGSAMTKAMATLLSAD